MQFLARYSLLCSLCAALFSSAKTEAQPIPAAEARVSLANQACDRGNKFKARGDYKEALKCFQEATALNPRDGSLHKYLAEALLAAHLPKQAMKEIDQAIRLSPRDPKVHISKGAILENLKHEDQAADEYRTAVAMGNCGQAVFDYLYKVYLRKKDYKAALNLMDIRTKEYPDDPRSHMGKANVRLMVKDYSGALEAAQRAAKLAPFDYRPRELSGDALLNMGKPAEAIKEYSKALDLEPFFTATIYTNRARAYKLIGRDDLAGKDWLKARE